jgi:hypothetical protein
LAEPASRTVANDVGKVVNIHLRNMKVFAKAQQKLLEGGRMTPRVMGEH